MKKIKELFRLAEKRKLILHTPLISIIYFLSIYRVIIQTNYPITTIELIISIILLAFLTIFCFWVVKKILKEKVKSAVVITIFLGFAFNAISFGKLFSIDNILMLTADSIFSGNQFLTSVVILLLALSLITLIVYLLRFSFNRFNNYLNVLLIYFLIVEIFNLFTFEPKRIELDNPVKLNVNPTANTENLPDIYYIIFDAYTSFKSLKKYWNYENTQLKNFLTKSGFYVASESRSNYNQTHFTLASTLNMSYLRYESFNSLTLEHYPNLFRLIKDNSLSSILKKCGYRIINYSLFDLSNTNKFYRFDLIDEPGFFKNTLFKWILSVDYLTDVLKLKTVHYKRSFELVPEISNSILNTASSSAGKPFFLYAHYMIPHPPFYFDRDGSSLMPYEYSSDVSDKWKYLDQLKYANKIIINLVDSILSHSERRAVIIIQGDHGFRSLKDKKEQGAESHSNLNTFYFPDGDYSLLYNTISSVNTFRVLLNKLGIENIELLPDKSYFVAKGIGF